MGRIYKMERLARPEEELVCFYCPGCESTHCIAIAGPKAWGWNGSMEKPTFTPSILVTTEAWNDPEDAEFTVPATCCHSFVKEGRIEYLADSTHPLAGKTVDLPEVDERGQRCAP